MKGCYESQHTEWYVDGSENMYISRLDMRLDEGSVLEGIDQVPIDCSIIQIQENNNHNIGGTFTFWVTGMFEDEGVGLQGDMNDDDLINVVDVVALVNIIIGE